MRVMRLEEQCLKKLNETFLETGLGHFRQLPAVCGAEFENAFLLYYICKNYCCLLRLQQIALGHKALTAQYLVRRKKNGISSFLQLKIWKNLFKKMLAQEHASFVSVICIPEHNSFYQQYSVSCLINIK